jgi:hypothetical protein
MAADGTALSWFASTFVLAGTGACAIRVGFIGAAASGRACSVRAGVVS